MEICVHDIAAAPDQRIPMNLDRPLTNNGAAAESCPLTDDKFSFGQHANDAFIAGPEFIRTLFPISSVPLASIIQCILPLTESEQPKRTLGCRRR
jgi:hypothetical protein